MYNSRSSLFCVNSFKMFLRWSDVHSNICTSHFQLFFRFILRFIVLVSIFKLRNCKVTCTYELNFFDYACRLTNQVIIYKSDMFEIDGTHLAGYDDKNVTALRTTNWLWKFFLACSRQNSRTCKNLFWVMQILRFLMDRWKIVKIYRWFRSFKTRSKLFLPGYLKTAGICWVYFLSTLK